MPSDRRAVSRIARPAEADVCIIVEGCYPYVAGGVSSWIDWLLRNQPDLTFSIVAIVSGDEPREQRYRFPDNVVGFSELRLDDPDVGRAVRRPFALPFRSPALAPEASDALADGLVAMIKGGGIEAYRRVIAIASARAPGSPTLRQLTESRLAWQLVTRMYEQLMPHASLLQFYWAWRALFGGLFAVLKAPLPPARLYHTISTGYAGVLAARAAVETGRPAVVTEHGIYTNERRIDILMAEWIADTVEKGLSLDDERLDLRDIWLRAFEAYARVCYEACASITTLYAENQRLQLSFGAAPGKLRVIANGIDVERFSSLQRAGPGDRPTMALIGRVVPIKDVKTFIGAVARVRARVPAMRALVLGPTEESAGYAEECRQLVRALGLEDCLTFTGPVDIRKYLPSIHVVVLTSLSEAQPLVLLEAGAAGIPCVTTDVGSCREILEGAADESPRLGPGGIVTPLVAPDEIAEAVSALLLDEPLRQRMGEALCLRTERYYHTRRSRDAYAALYRELHGTLGRCSSPGGEGGLSHG